MTVFDAEIYKPEHFQQWNEFVDRSDNRHFIARRSFMEYHSHRFADCSVIISRANKICALFPASVAGDVLSDVSAHRSK